MAAFVAMPFQPAPLCQRCSVTEKLSKLKASHSYAERQLLNRIRRMIETLRARLAGNKKPDRQPGVRASCPA